VVRWYLVPMGIVLYIALYAFLGWLGWTI